MISESLLLSRQDRAGVPVKHQGLYLDSWHPYNELSEAALAAAQGFVGSFPKRLAWRPVQGSRELVGEGIVFVGPHSTGKTTLCSLIANELIRDNFSVCYIAFADYISELLHKMSVQSQADKLEPRAMDVYWTIEDHLQLIHQADFVVLDDIGKEHRTHSKFAEDELDKLLRYRHRKGRPTGANTNLPLSKWGSVYDPSMAGFVLECFEEVGLGGKNLRSKK